MYKLPTILYQFNRPLFVFNLMVSFYLLYRSDRINYPEALFTKACVFMILLGYQYFTANQTYFYYRNSGFSIRRLYVYSIIADMAVYSILAFLLFMITYGFAHA